MDRMNRRCHFIKRPTGMPEDECFEWRDEPIPDLQDGEFLIENEYFSFEASMRTWMNEGPNYMPPIRIGEVMRGPTMGIVRESRNGDFPEGLRVMGMHGWERYSIAASGPFEQVIPDVPGVSPTLFMGVLGLVGMTAYFGIEDICVPGQGETLLVSGAAGAVGSVAVQLGKIRGARVVGIAGADDKCGWLREVCGVDATINYRAGNLRDAIGAACPDGIDAYFDNVGGETLDAALWHMNDKGRIACCGTIAGYNDSDAPSPPVHNLWLVVIRQLQMQGFLVSDYFDRFGEAGEKLMGWVRSGQLGHREHIIEGLEKAPEALRTLLSGGNRGKTLLRI